MDLENFIEELEEIVESATKVPLSTKCMVDREEIWDVIQQFRLNYPSEIKEAQWVKKERERILNEAREEAKNITDRAKQEVAEMVNETEIVKFANNKAEETIKGAETEAINIKHIAGDEAKRIIDDAEERANEYKRRAVQYFDELLERAEEIASDTKETVYSAYIELNSAYNKMDKSYRETDNLLEKINTSRHAISSNE